MSDPRFQLQVDGQLSGYYDYLTPARAEELAERLRGDGYEVEILPHNMEHL